MKCSSLLVMAAALSIVLGSPAALAQDDTPIGRRAGPQALPAGITARYLVTYLKSNTSDPALRSATIVTVTNETITKNCTVAVEWKTGGISTACTTSLTLGPGKVADFCSRSVPSGITSCDITCAPELTFNEGNAVVGSSTNEVGCDKIAVSARTVYTATTTDSPVSAITDAKIVKFTGNIGD